MNLEERLDRSLRELGVVEGDRVGVACSGGADSVALLHLARRSDIDLELIALHVDHRLRPDSSGDATFVEELARSMGLECRILRATVVVGGSLEAAARDARYEALEEAARSAHLDWVATAHTMDDQAETVLLRALRGGSLEGIAPVRGAFIRPLLDTGRDELRSWLFSHGLPWREDPTNNDVRIERNWLRAEVLPLLRDRRTGVTKVLARIASTARADGRVLDALASEVLSRAPVDGAGILLPADELEPLPEAIAVRVLRGALRNLGADPSWTELDAIRALRIGARMPCGDVTVWRIREGLALLSDPPVLPDPVGVTQGVFESPDWGVRLRLGPADADPWAWRCVVPESEVLVLRGRRPGDRVPTAAGTRKVQDVLVDARVPRPLRDFVPLVATVKSPLAVVGLTSAPIRGAIVVDAEPVAAQWSRCSPWSRANS